MWRIVSEFVSFPPSGQTIKDIADSLTKSGGNILERTLQILSKFTLDGNKSKRVSKELVQNHVATLPAVIQPRKR